MQYSLRCKTCASSCLAQVVEGDLLAGWVCVDSQEAKSVVLRGMLHLIGCIRKHVFQLTMNAIGRASIMRARCMKGERNCIKTTKEMSIRSA